MPHVPARVVQHACLHSASGPLGSFCHGGLVGANLGHTVMFFASSLDSSCRPAAGVGRSCGATLAAAPHTCVPLWHGRPAQAQVRRKCCIGGLLHHCACTCIAGLLQHKAGHLSVHTAPTLPRVAYVTPPALLRLLPLCSDEQQARLLDGCRTILGASPFRFDPSWVRIISGADEGVYGWIALNYLAGTCLGGWVGG